MHLQLIHPAFQLILKHQRLRRLNLAHRNHLTGKCRIHPVQRMQRTHKIENLLRRHPLNLRPDHIYI